MKLSILLLAITSTVTLTTSVVTTSDTTTTVIVTTSAAVTQLTPTPTIVTVDSAESSIIPVTTIVSISPTTTASGMSYCSINISAGISGWSLCLIYMMFTNLAKYIVHTCM